MAILVAYATYAAIRQLARGSRLELLSWDIVLKTDEMITIVNKLDCLSPSLGRGSSEGETYGRWVGNGVTVGS